MTDYFDEAEERWGSVQDVALANVTNSTVMYDWGAANLGECVTLLAADVNGRAVSVLSKNEHSEESEPLYQISYVWYGFPNGIYVTKDIHRLRAASGCLYDLLSLLCVEKDTMEIVDHYYALDGITHFCTCLRAIQAGVSPTAWKSMANI